MHLRVGSTACGVLTWTAVVLSAPAASAAETLPTASVAGTVPWALAPPPSQVPASLTLGPVPALVSVATGAVPDGMPRGVQFGQFLQGATQALAIRHFQPATAGPAVVSVRIEQISARCNANPVKASCVVAWNVALQQLSTKIVVAQQDVRAEIQDVDCRAGLTGPPMDDNEHEMYRRKLNGGTEALRRALVDALLQTDALVAGKRDALAMDVPTMRGLVEKALVEKYRAEFASVFAPDGGFRALRAPTVDELVRHEGCDVDLGLAVCLSALKRTGIIKPEDVATWRDRGLTSALDQGLKWQPTPAYVTLFAQAQGVFALSAVDFSVRGPLVPGPVAALVRLNRHALAVMAKDGAVWLIPTDETAPRQIGVLDKGLASVVAESTELGGNALTVKYSSGGTSAVRTARFVLPDVGAPIDMPAGLPLVREVNGMWGVESALPFASASRIVTLSPEVRAKPIVVPLTVAAAVPAAFADQFRARVGWLRDAGLYERIQPALQVGGHWQDMSADLQAWENFQLAGKAVARRALTDASEAAADAQKVQDARVAKEAAERRAESNKQLAVARKFIKQVKGQDALKAASQACQTDPDNQDACALAQELNEASEQREEAIIERRKQAEQQAKLSQVPAFVRECTSAVELYERARQEQGRAAASGRPADVNRATNALNVAQQRYNHARTNLREVVAIYNSRGQREAARGVEVAAGRCLR